MVNRILIRIIVVQTLYSYLINKNETFTDSKIKLKKSLDEAYNLYLYLLILPAELTRLQMRRIDEAKGKYLPSEDELNPNMKFVDNLFVKAVNECKPLHKFIKDYNEDIAKERAKKKDKDVTKIDRNLISWADDEIALRLILDKILNSDIYARYMSGEILVDSNASEEKIDPVSDLENDAEFWRQVMRKIILPDEDFAELLESKSIFWNDDLEIVGAFAVKTFRRFLTEEPQNVLLPQFKDAEDEKFAEILLETAIRQKDRYTQLIEKYVGKTWDFNRLPFMDIVILLCAIAELEKIQSVPVAVTVNEFIELAKYYSTQNSGQFVNGILYSIIKELKAEGTMLKNID